MVSYSFVQIPGIKTNSGH